MVASAAQARHRLLTRFRCGEATTRGAKWGEGPMARTSRRGDPGCNDRRRRIALPSLEDRRTDAWTTLAAEPAVRAAERAIVTGSATVVADTLAVAAAGESRRRLDHVLDLKARADADAGRRDAYVRAADDFRSWAGGVYLATLRNPQRDTPADGPHTEASASIRRSVLRPPFPHQRKRRPQTAAPTNEKEAR
jgi:hypothetical protein